MMTLAALIIAVIALVWAAVDRGWQLALLAAAVVLLALAGLPASGDWIR
ncbi:hypothetical protein [Actinomadura sp. WMMA1423]|nr:hypothetical protein [Actinomadura sp. WMMA1423]